jgi:pimeloyl-ACP methyl ester carboxylesterase
MDVVWTPTRLTASDGVRLATYHAGPADAPPVVFVHGYPDHHAVWDLVAAELVEDHHLIAYDVRGAGASGVPARRDGWRLDRLLADLAQVVDEVAGGGPVHLVGHDWGSIQAWAFVLHPQHRRRVATLTSMSGPPLQHVERQVRRWATGGPGGWATLLRQGTASSYIGFFQTPMAPVAWRNVLGPRWAGLVEREHARTDARWPGPTIGEDAANGVGLYRAHRRAMLPPFRADRLPPAEVPTDVPVTLLVATDDRSVRPPLVAGLEAFAPDLERRELTGGHWLPRSRPTEVAAAVRARVAGHGSGAGGG